ncbi:MAG: aminomethyl-transferring glycine dehydrogenase subunit GcvPB [candidate division WOR-3 bacterium]|nr:MAG: aminomethyl-transferring glycine dehydrogenase subunit GcvPB [candidate division WOR-3 bacterium]
MELIFEQTKDGRRGYSLPSPDVPSHELTAAFRRQTTTHLPEVSEPQIIRHFVNLSVMNHHVDKNFYPLGSCTMKYNPKINEETARLHGYTRIHPLQPQSTTQGALALMYGLGEYLKAIVNLDGITLQPAAGAQGEFTAISMFKAYFNKKKEARKYILVPDSAHGTNPASVNFSGFQPLTLPSSDNGLVDVEKLIALMTPEVAGLMLTNPNTLGLFERNVKKITGTVHDKGGLVYLDGANLNALLGITRAGDMGFDAVHFNLHKTFSTPHGGGGPGSGPVAVINDLLPFLPVPTIVYDGKRYGFDFDVPDSIGKVQTFYGNFLVMVRAYTYLRLVGAAGLRNISKSAILNANYVIQSLKDDYLLPYTDYCMHEGVLSGRQLKESGLRTLDVAKRLLDYGLHAPTIYFPLIVSEALMIEPTDSESKETLDEFVNAMKKILEEAKEQPDLLRNAPHNTPVRRLDEVKAIKQLNIKWKT